MPSSAMPSTRPPSTLTGWAKERFVIAVMSSITKGKTNLIYVFMVTGDLLFTKLYIYMNDPAKPGLIFVNTNPRKVCR
jgi:hypothetical protein